MKHYIVLSFSVLASVFLKAQTTKPLTLREAIDLARSKSPAFTNAQLDTEIEKIRKMELTTGWFPKLNASYDSRYNAIRQTLVLPAEAFGGPAGEFRTILQGTPWISTPSIDLTQTVFDPNLMSDNRLQRMKRKQVDADKLKAEQDLVFEVTKAYYSLAYATQKESEAQSDVERNKEYLKQAQARFSQGTALKTDVDQARLNVSLAETALRKASSDIETAAASLAQAMGTPDETAYRSSQKLDEFMEAESSTGDLSGDKMYSNRPDWIRESLNKEAAKLQITKTKWSYAPVLSGYATLATQAFRTTFNFYQTGQDWYRYAFVGAKVSMPVFDGLQRMYIQKRQKIEMMKNDQNLNLIRNKARYELTDAFIRAKNARSSYRDQQENLKLAQEILAQVEAGYREGVRTRRDVLDAEYTYAQTRSAALRALYDLLQAGLDSKKATGNLR